MNLHRFYYFYATSIAFSACKSSLSALDSYGRAIVDAWQTYSTLQRKGVSNMKSRKWGKWEKDQEVQ